MSRLLARRRCRPGPPARPPAEPPAGGSGHRGAPATSAARDPSACRRVRPLVAPRRSAAAPAPARWRRRGRRLSPPSRRRQQRAQPHRGRLAGPVRPEEPVDLTDADLQIEVFDGREPVEAPLERLGPDGGRRLLGASVRRSAGGGRLENRSGVVHGHPLSVSPCPRRTGRNRDRASRKKTGGRRRTHRWHGDRGSCHRSRRRPALDGPPAGGAHGEGDCDDCHEHGPPQGAVVGGPEPRWRSPPTM